MTATDESADVRRTDAPDTPDAAPRPGRPRPTLIGAIVTALVLAASGAGALVLLLDGTTPASCAYGVSYAYCGPYGSGGTSSNSVGIDTPNGSLTLQTPAGTVVSSASSTPPSVPPPPQVQSLPAGVLSFTISQVAPGATIPITITLPQGTIANGYYKFQNGVWTDFTSHAAFLGNLVTLVLTDNGPGDADPTLGVINDPGAPVLVDASPPLIVCPAPPDFTLGQPGAQLTVSVTDSGSGTPAPSVTVPVSTTAVGAHLQVNVTAADNAGNQATVGCTYSVHYQFTGFAAPIKNGDLTRFGAGGVVPTRWSLADFQGVPAGSAPSFAGVTSAPIDCTTKAVTGPAVPGTVQGAVHVDHGDFLVQWATDHDWKGSCRVETVTLDDGTTHQAWFSFA